MSGPRHIDILPVLIAFAFLLCSTAGCDSTHDRQRLNAPPQGAAEQHPRLVQYFAYHDDQGMVADMGIADIHFIPHSADLSGTGEVRLGRYAEILATSGGTIYYEPQTRDQALIDARVASAKAFLEQAIPSTKTIEVAVGLRRGRGISSQEASDARRVAEQAEVRGYAYRLKESTGSLGD